MERGCRTFMLETGPAQSEALMLYERLGYRCRRSVHHELVGSLLR